jgi:hypothetical protein
MCAEVRLNGIQTKLWNEPGYENISCIQLYKKKGYQQQHDYLNKSDQETSPSGKRCCVTPLDMQDY